MRLKDKRIFITAAGQGIGRAIAEACIKEGARVVASDLNGSLVDDLDCETCALDVTKKEAISKTIRAADPEVLINCAGYVHTDTVQQVTDENLDFAFDVNLRSMIYTIQAAIPAMLERQDGAIINIASIASSTKGFPNRCTYGLTKGAVIGLTKSVAADYMTQGIRCNCISPGTVDSPSLQDRLAATGDYDAAMKAFIARQPMGRLGTVEEMGHLAVYLASDESKYMTGQEVRIDGGTTA